MSSIPIAASIRRLRGLMAAQCRSAESDEQLLHAFTALSDEDAFAVLVHRHGPMVLHVCRRVLEHEQDAEDAFQTTFLLLARNAAGLRNKTALAAFLHGAAYRIAQTAKRSAARRRKHEGSVGALTQPRSPADPADELSWREVRALLDEEIARLPEKFRIVFVLFHLEDLSREETARRLGLKDATVAKRLAEVRKRLAQRLALRGVELTAVLAATGLAAPMASALPAGLMTSTIKSVVATVAGESLADVVSASVAELVQGMAAAVMVSKTKMAAVLVLAVTLLGGASAWVAESRTDKEPGERSRVSVPSEARGALLRPRLPEVAKTVEIQGWVLGVDGKPKAWAKLLLLSEEGKIAELGVSAADGRFTVAVPKRKKQYDLVAQADGAGIDFIDLDPSKPGKPVELCLVKDNAIRGRVVTTEGKPVRGVHVSVRSIVIYKSIDAVLDALKKRRHRWARTPGEVKSLLIEPIELLSATTDIDGRFTIHGIGSERFASLRISGRGIADANTHSIVNRSGFDAQSYNRATLEDIPKEDEPYFAPRATLTGPEATIIAEAEKPIHGIVKEADTGKGRPNVVVRLRGITHLQSVDIPHQAKTDALGRYEIHGARKAKSYLFRVQSDPAAAYMSCEVLAA